MSDTQTAPTYYAALTGHDMHDSATAWERLAATTLRGAKAEATRRLGGGYYHHQLHIGEESGMVCRLSGDPVIITVSSRGMTDRRWTDV